MKEKWIKRGTELSPIQLKETAEKWNVSEEAVRIAANRGVTNFAEYFGEGVIFDGEDMLDMRKAVRLLTSALQNGENIRIVGDYDMDGCMSTYILHRALKGLVKKYAFSSRISYDIPDRIKDGYGINERIVRSAYDDKVDVLLTCDNGIAAFDALDLARCLCITTIVTDHHRVPQSEEGNDILVDADAIVNPHRQGDPTEYKDICGAVVAFKLVRNLYRSFGLSREYVDKTFLGYAAFATITDVMPLIKENRSIVKKGLPLLRSNYGLSVLCDKCKIDPKHKLTSEDIGFTLGPCGNAAGRIGDVKDMLWLLEHQEKSDVEVMAVKLVSLNEKRKDLCSIAEEKACKIADERIASGDRVLVLYVPGTHEGIVGIVAGRIREKYNLPSFVFTDAEEGLKGSGRSTETWDMFAHLTEAKEYTVRFGGHPGAAGVTVASEEMLIQLRDFLNAHCEIPDEDLIRKVYYDDELSVENLTVPMIESLSALEPVGTGNEAPIFFMRDIKGSLTIIGKDYQTVRIRPENTDASLIAFRAGDATVEKAARKYRLDENEIRFSDSTTVKVSLVGKTSINEFQGNKTPQLIMDSYVFV